MIDWNRIRELQDDFGEETFDEVATVFLAEVEDALTALTTKATDAGALAAALHFLKGSALNLGFRDLAAQCSEGERTASAGHPERVDIGALSRMFVASRARFEAGRASVGVA